MKNESECTDLSYLSSLANGSNEFIQQMISVFMEQTPKALDSIDNSLLKKDWKSLAAVAHKIKPSFAFMGIKQLEPVIADIEDSCQKEQNLDSLSDKINEVRQVCKCAMVELEEKSKHLA
jgi:HPt (histidine-containing phosphotransfer) domain-containing protein